MHRPSAPLLLGVLAIVCVHDVCAADATTTPPDAGLRLRLAPDLTPPAIRVRRLPGAPAARPSPPTPASKEDARREAIFLRAESVEGSGEHQVDASGDVELRTRRETVLADWLRYDFTEEEVWGKGDVLLRRGFDWITGPEARFRTDDETGFFKAPRYFLGENGGRGTATEIRFMGPQQFAASDARYTTCVAPREDWYIKMGELEIDQTRKVGTARNASIVFLGAPIAYTPWLSFPLSDERKSGFLAPTLGSTGSRGFEVATPYYFNLAPNYDATVTPRIMTKRGVQMGGQFRYLWNAPWNISSGEMNAEYLPNDRVTDTNRYALSWKHNQNLTPITAGLNAYWDLNKVSDDTYFADLADRIAFTSVTTLVREGGLSYVNGPLYVLARAQAFQTLQDPTAPPVGKPYNRMPQVQTALRETDWSGFTFAGTGEYTRFVNPTLPDSDRVYVYPTVSWNRQGPAWFFTARAGVHARYYAIEQQPGPGTTNYGFTIPIASLDGGLVFERDWHAFGRDMIQTLEPRAFYAYIPYHNQNGVPAFDTAVDDYNFNQLFSENRYLGNDRIGDANQLTLALTSRLIEPGTGAERVRLAVGQRFYFEDQRVTLNETPRSASSSDLLFLAEGRLTEAWTLASLMQYNFDVGRSERFDAAARYMPEPGKALNASYRYTRQFLDPSVGIRELKQFDIAAQWPIARGWSFLGRWNYSLADRKTLEAVVGVEYNGDCWVVRAVGQRLTTTTQTTTSSVYLQLELTGLARLGTNPLDLLRRSVSGYVRTNDPAVSPRDRGDVFPEF